LMRVARDPDPEPNVDGVRLLVFLSILRVSIAPSVESR
jgi:hypothetical protein